MCQTQRILDNIDRLKGLAFQNGNLDLVSKLDISRRDKIIRLLHPSSKIRITYFPDQVWEVIHILEENLFQKTFLAKNERGLILRFQNLDVTRYVADPNPEYRPAKKKVKFNKTYTSIRKISIPEFVELCKGMKRVSKRKKQWLSLINSNKLTCPASGEKVSYVSYDKTRQGSYHYNFYSESGRLFTVDHIVPISKGGPKMSVKNLQPMIAKYNWKKGSQDNEKYLARYRK